MLFARVCTHMCSMHFVSFFFILQAIVCLYVPFANALNICCCDAQFALYIFVWGMFISCSLFTRVYLRVLFSPFK